MTLLERLDAEIALCKQLSPHDPFRCVAELLQEAATEIRRLTEEVDREIAIRDEKIQQLLDTLEQYTDTTRLA